MDDAPPDLIIEIARLTPPSHALDTSTGLWTLAQVNRHWRSVVKQTQSLWTTLRFDSVSPNPARRNYEMCIAHESLRLSGGLPLSFFYRDSPSIRNDPGSVWLLQMLTAQSRRWRTVRLTFGLPMHFVQLTRIRRAIGALERLHIQTLFNIATNDVFESQLLTFLVAPSLRDLTLEYSTALVKMDFPLTQLTTYREFGGPNVITPRPHAEILPLITNVDHLVLTRCEDDDEDDDDDVSETVKSPLPVVQRLAVNGAEVLDLIDSAPALQDLQVVETDAENIFQIVPLIHRSRCNLLSLTLHLIDNLDGANLVKVLGDVSTLRYLQISADDYDHLLISRLAVGVHNPECLLRGLQSLTILCSGDPKGHVDQPSVDSMLNARLGVNGFMTFFLSIGRNSPPRTLTRPLMTTISQKRRQGCRVIIEIGVSHMHHVIFNDSHRHLIQWR